MLCLIQLLHNKQKLLCLTMQLNVLIFELKVVLSCLQHSVYYGG